MKHAFLTIEDEKFEVTSLTGNEGLSELYRFDVLCAYEPIVDARHWLDRPAVVRLTAHGAERQVSGIVARAARRVSDEGTAALAFVLRPEAHRLTLGRDCRPFHDKTIVGIADEVLAQVPHRWELTRDYDVRAYTVQYREDDWTFLSRLLEDEGIYYWFDHEDGSKLVFGDASPRAPELAGGATVTFAYESAMIEGAETVLDLGSEVCATATKFTIGSFDPARPRLSVQATEGEGGLEMYDAPGAGPRTPDSCRRRAADLREAALAARDGVAGTTTSVRVTPGRVLEIAGHPVTRYDRRFLVTETRYEVMQRRQEEQERTYQCSFRAIPVDARYRPPARTPRARQAGLQSGIVVGASGAEIHPDGEGRVRVQLHWDRKGARNDAAGTWMRVSQRGTADSMLLPRIGWNVLTFNEEGAVDDPALLSRIHDTEHPPAYSLPGTKTRTVFKTATSPADGSFNEVHFEDSKGSEEMFINASRDMNVLVQNEKSEQVQRDVTRSVVQNHDLAVGTDYVEIIGGNQDVKVDGNESIKVLGSRKKQIDKNETETIGASRDLHVGQSHNNNVVGTRKVNVGTAMIEATLGPIASTSGAVTTVLVGGAAVKVSAQSISEAVELGSIQTIGGAKLEIAGGGRSIESKLIHLETVGGAMVLKTAGEYSNKAAVGMSYNVGGLLSMTSPTLTIVAKTKIVLTCGDTSITITPETVEISATKLDLSNSNILQADGTRLDHN